MLPTYLIDILVTIINTAVILIIFVSFAYATIEFILHYCNEGFGRPGKRALVSVKGNRIKLGENLLFALEILICADIIVSVQEPTMDHLTKLGILILIRILIAYFLEREIRELTESDYHQKKDK